MAKTLEVKTFRLGIFKFWMPDNGGNIYLESDTRHGLLGRVLCEHGGFAGKEIQATPANFKRECRHWLRQHKKNWRDWAVLHTIL